MRREAGNGTRNTAKLFGSGRGPNWYAEVWVVFRSGRGPNWHALGKAKKVNGKKRWRANVANRRQTEALQAQADGYKRHAATQRCNGEKGSSASRSKCNGTRNTAQR